MQRIEKSGPVALRSSNFKEEVLESKRPVLVDFWASWCPACKAADPIMNELAEDFSDIKIAKVNVDQNPNLASRYEITGVPTFILFKDGEVVSRHIGAQSKNQLIEILKKA